MKLKFLSLLALFVGIGIVSAADDKKPATITVLLPEKAKAKLTIDGEETKQTGAKRIFTTAPLEPGKTYTYKIETVIEPNNYTKIMRNRDVNFKAGEEITLDLSKEDKKLDKIVVRWVPTPDDIVDEMCKLGKVTKDDVVYDPGCGDAIMLCRPIKQFGAKKGIGIDIDPKMVVEAKKMAEKYQVVDKVVIRQGDILNEKDMADLSEASVVLLYIGDDLGARMEPLLRKLLKPGSRIVSHRFSIGDWKPEKSVTVMGADGDEYMLHLWIVPEPKK